jgi:hypothetical protein
MSTGALLLIGITVVTVTDMLFAMYFRSLADRVESGETASSSIDPPRARKTANLLLINGPIIWLVAALFLRRDPVRDRPDQILVE